MFLRKGIKIKASKEIVIQKLLKQKRSFPPYGNVTATNFRIFKEVTNGHWKLFSLHVITGTIVEKDGTTILYTIRPDVLKIAAAGILFLMLIYGFLLVASGNERKDLILVIFLMNLLFHSIETWQTHICAARFEKAMRSAENNIAENLE